MLSWAIAVITDCPRFTWQPDIQARAAGRRRQQLTGEPVEDVHVTLAGGVDEDLAGAGGLGGCGLHLGVDRLKRDESVEHLAGASKVPPIYR